MWRQKIETEAKVMNVRNLSEHSASMFYVFTAMTSSFLKIRFILLKRIANKQKNTVGLYILGSILPKNEMNY